MDRDTLLGHKELWGEEPQDRRCLHDLDALDGEESALYDDLRFDRLGPISREPLGLRPIACGFSPDSVRAMA